MRLNIIIAKNVHRCKYVHLQLNYFCPLLFAVGKNLRHLTPPAQWFASFDEILNYKTIS